MSVTIGTRLGPHEIVALIGAGGMGEVYKAQDTRLDRTVAIKILPENLAADPQFGDRFEREARTISQLDHTQYLRALRLSASRTARRSSSCSTSTARPLLTVDRYLK
jgi:serine/threonine protein kinase